MRFHADVELPAQVLMPAFGRALTYGIHALKAATVDGVQHQLPCALPSYTLIEVETLEDAQTPIKWVVRTHLDVHRDLVLVLTSEYFVKTVWVNIRDDNHRTLDRTRYDRLVAVHKRRQSEQAV